MSDWPPRAINRSWAATWVVRSKIRTWEAPSWTRTIRPISLAGTFEVAVLGSHLVAELGDGYLSIAVTAVGGRTPARRPAPGTETGVEVLTVDLAEPAPGSVEALLAADAAGNRYYIQSKGIGPLGVPRRWVIYANGAEASQVTPDWHGWMHYTVDTPPTEEDYQPRPWQKPHQANMTGTAQAYRPRGSILASGRRPKATGDYKPWRPN